MIESREVERTPEAPPMSSESTSLLINQIDKSISARLHPPKQDL